VVFVLMILRGRACLFKSHSLPSMCLVLLQGNRRVAGE